MSTDPKFVSTHSTVAAPGTVVGRDVSKPEPSRLDKFTEGLATVGVRIGEAALKVAGKVATGLSKTGYIRVALVGCGDIARTHVDALMQCNNRAMITALCDPSSECRDSILAMIKAHTQWEVPPQFPTLEAALGFDDTHSLFDAVFILAPTEMHEDLAIKACLAKKHVFIETPIAMTAEGAARIVAAAADAGVVCFVGEQSQFWHEVLLAKAVIDSGEMGRVLTVRARMSKSKLETTAAASTLRTGLSAGPIAPAEPLAASAGKTDALRVGGGFMFDSGLHWIRPMRIWMGNVESVVAYAGHAVPDVPFSMGHAILRFSSGCYGSFEAIYSDSPLSRQPWFDIQCERGEIVIDSAFDGGYGVKVFSIDHPQGVLASQGPQGWSTAFKNEITDFIDRCFPIAMGDVSHAQMAVNDLQTMLCMKRSVEIGDWVKVPRIAETTPVCAYPDNIALVNQPAVVPEVAYPTTGTTTGAMDTSTLKYTNKPTTTAGGAGGTVPLPLAPQQQQQVQLPVWGMNAVPESSRQYRP